MAASTERQYPLKRRKRRRRKKGQFYRNAIAFLFVVILLFVTGVLFWRAMQFVWNEVEDVLPIIAPKEPTESESMESTVPDCEAPILTGAHDFTVYQGDTIAYLDGITATDETDLAPTVTVDSSAVDLNHPGEYQITYTAKDASGNAVEKKATVTVLEWREGYADLDTIYAAADAKLAEILRENATPTQQVQDIYAWARINLGYSGHTDRSDRYQAAYGMLTEGRGDCFGYFAVTKLLFERLGIQNIDVRKVKNSADDSDHFWSMVSLDGGESWYHFDATPRYGSGDGFCLVTDAFLDAYSESHKGSHNRDKFLYPATP